MQALVNLYNQILWRIILPLIPASLLRIAMKIIAGKNRFKYKDCPDVFSKIYSSNYWKSSESHSGYGSILSTTKTIRKMLPALWEQYQIKTFLDVPCGDYNWMKEVPKENITYIGGDIVAEMINENNKKYSAENVSFKVIDITKDDLPAVDMIFCKDCLQHLSYENVFKALANFKKSNSKYLLTTSYPKTLFNWDIFSGDCRPLNLLKKPFCLPKPIAKIREKSSGIHIDSDKYIYLYRLKDLPKAK